MPTQGRDGRRPGRRAGRTDRSDLPADDAEAEPTPSVPSLRPAATVALLRPGPDGPEVLLGHRPPTMAFGPGLHVFPGGGVDAADRDPRLLERSVLAAKAAGEALAGELPPEAALALHVAAVRELFEEAGILLARGPDRRPFLPADSAEAGLAAAARSGGVSFLDLAERLDLVLATDTLVPLSRWVTPPGLPRRFDTRFFVAWLPERAEATLAGGEVVAHEWLTPRAALDAMAARRIQLWQPTCATLAQLAGLPDLEALRRALGPPRVASPPRVDGIGPGVMRVRVGGAGGIPGAETNAYLVGRDRLVVVDPGDPGEQAIEALLAAVSATGGEVAAIALTQPTPDHAAGAEWLALRLGVPIHAAGRGRLPRGTHPLADGAVLEAGDLALDVLAAPGPDPDHVVLALRGRGIVLAGDLVAGPSRRALPAPRDEALVDASWARLLAREPRLLLPAHGDPVDV